MKRIYVLRSQYFTSYSLGVGYYNFHVVYPGHNHAYHYEMSIEGYKHFIKHLNPDLEVKQLPWSEDKNLWTMIKEHEQAIAADKAASA